MNQKDLVRYYYANKEDVFDGVSYNKGGRILHMLRNYVGDDAFFKSLNNYLTTNKFKTGEAAQLRLAFEEVTGKDLNWFWNQWYYSNGHPKLKIDYNFDIPGIPNVAEVIVEQTQKSGKIFTLPIAIDVYTDGKAKRYNVWLRNKTDTFHFDVNSKPELINVDAEKILLGEKTDNKSEANFIAQYKYAKNYLDRKEALDFFAKKNMPEIAKGLHDKFYKLKVSTIQKIGTSPYKADPVVLGDIEEMAKKDNNKKVKAAAINYLVKNGDRKYLSIFEAAVSDSSYSVAGAALKGIIALDSVNAYTIAKKYSNDAKGALGNAVMDILFAKGTEADFESIAKSYNDAAPSQEKVGMTADFGDYLLKVNDISKLKKGVDYMMRFRNIIPEQYRVYVDPTYKTAFDKISKEKGKEVEDYINSVFK